MAIRGQEVELLGDGIRADSPTKGAFALNMLYRRNSWEVRRGFGQVTELDTTMRAGAPPVAPGRWGYMEHLGSYAMRTSFGHDQIISVFTASVWSGDRLADPTPATGGTNNNSTLSKFIPIYVVSIYDVTTNDRWEEPIFRHTAEFGDSATSKLEMPDWHGHYETWWRNEVELVGTMYVTTAPGSILEDRQQWLLVNEDAEQFFFTELSDILYFGNKDTGLLAYMPSIFRGRTRGGNNLSVLERDKQVTTVYDRSWAPPYSETSVVINAVASDGPFPDGITYLTRSEFPSPRGASNIGGRLALFDERTIYFSDVGYPTSIAADNVMYLPSEDNITALVEHEGTLIIFTDNETWYYQPSQGFVFTTGRLVRIAEGIGCLSDNSYVSAEGALVWMDKRGVYTFGGGVQPPTKISEPIEPFFNDYISNPVTNFFLDSGELSALPIPEQTAVSFKRLGPVAASYNRTLEAVVFSLPAVSAALYFSRGKWSLWSTQTMVASNAASPPASRRTANIRSPWIVNFDDGMYLVGSVPPDEGGEALTTGQSSRSYYILKYGRGGAIDRSVEATEDYRLVRGFWKEYSEKATGLTPANSDHYLYVGKPVPIPEGMSIGPLDVPAQLSPASEAVDGAVWVPLLFSLGYRDELNAIQPTQLPDNMALTFTFDNTNWAPILDPVTGGPQFFLPPERQATEGRWAVAIAGPNVVAATFATGGGAWTTTPYLSLNKRQLNRLIYLPFKPITTATTIGPHLVPTTTTFANRGGGPTIDIRSFVWDETFLFAQRHEDNDVAQAVDWAYKSAPVKTQDEVQVKGRGLYINALSHGAATPTQRLLDTWPFGLLNILSAPDTKGWSSQVIDVVDSTTGTPIPSSVTNVSSKNTLRTRYARNSTTALTTTTFNTTNGPVYGTLGAPMGASNAALVADEEISQLAVSDSVRGQSFTYMIWGSLQNKAERLVFESVRAVMRVLGGKKRRGR